MKKLIAFVAALFVSAILFAQNVPSVNLKDSDVKNWAKNCVSIQKELDKLGIDDDYTYSEAIAGIADMEKVLEKNGISGPNPINKYATIMQCAAVLKAEKEIASDAVIEMESDYQEKPIKDFSDSELTEILNELYVNDAVDIVEKMPANVVERILSHVDSEKRKVINQILQYPENSAGSIKAIEYISRRLGTTVGQAISLIGRLSLKDLLLSKDVDMLIDNIMKINVISVNTHADQAKMDEDSIAMTKRMRNDMIGVLKKNINSNDYNVVSSNSEAVLKAVDALDNLD